MKRAAHRAALVWEEGALRPGRVLVVGGDGRIAAIVPEGEAEGTLHDHGHAALVPGPVNVHSHSFQTLIRGPADRARGFRDWVDRYLYPLALAVDEEAVYQGALLAFAEMALNGFTAVGEFFYIQNGPPPDFAPGGGRFARAAIRAAREVGLRVHLLRTFYDTDGREGQKRFAERVDDAVRGARALREDWSEDPFISVAPAPHSLHGASEEMILAAVELGRSWGVKVHIHLAEERHDLELSRDRYGTTPLRALSRIGALGDWLVAVHGCWLDAEEIEMLGAAGAGLAFNPASNAALGDGVTDLPAMLRHGVRVGLGTDGACANNQQDPWREMRTAEYLQRIEHLEMGSHERGAGGARALFEAGTLGSATNLDMDAGELRPGAWADFVVLDLDDLSLQPTYGDDPDAVLHNIVYSMSARGAVRDVYVAGEAIVQDRALVRVKPERLAGMGRAWSLARAGQESG